MPLIVPGDAVMTFAGYQAGIGRLSFVLAYVVMEGATLLGASVLHWIGSWAGKPLLRRYGRYVHLDEERVKKIERWFKKHGPISVLLGRLIPGLRLHTSLIAGIMDIPYLVFLPFVAIGSSIYILFFMFLGLGLGREARRIIRLYWPYPTVLILATLAAIGLIALLAWWFRREEGQGAAES
ncbi:MAG: DedA family protein [Actinobacteria bacterium]|nr:DedA family protein [Actinomycetota bacterium]